MAKEKEVELKVKKEKVSEKDLTSLQNVVNKINALQFNVGKIESQKHNMLHDLAMTQDKVVMMQDQLMDRYGSYDVNLDDGTINWPKESENEK